MRPLKEHAGRAGSVREELHMRGLCRRRETTTVSEGINIGCPQWMGDETDARWCLLILYVREGRQTMSYGDVEYEDEQA